MVQCMAMRKTTVYIPDGLKAGLRRVSEETGRSEAELIREGICLVVARRTPPQPRHGTFESGDASTSERTDDLLEGFGQP